MAEEAAGFGFHNYGSFNDSDILPVVMDGRDDDDDEPNSRKRRKIGSHIIHHCANPSGTSQIQWQSYNEQRIYSTKLVRTLRYVLRRNPTKPNACRYVREAADRVLAATAKGRTRWSRAILSNTLRGRSRFRIVDVHKKVKKVNGNAMLKKRNALLEDLKRRRKNKNRQTGLPALEIENRALVLGRLVPGCRQVPLPNLLEEVTDYIAALEMQVRAMTAIADLLAGGAPTDRVDPSQPRDPIHSS